MHPSVSVENVPGFIRIRVFFSPFINVYPTNKGCWVWPILSRRVKILLRITICLACISLIDFGVTFTSELKTLTESLNDSGALGRIDVSFQQIFQNLLIWMITITIAMAKSVTWLIPPAAIKVVSLFIILPGRPFHSLATPVEEQIKSLTELHKRQE